MGFHHRLRYFSHLDCEDVVTCWHFPTSQVAQQDHFIAVRWISDLLEHEVSVWSVQNWGVRKVSAGRHTHRLLINQKLIMRERRDEIIVHRGHIQQISPCQQIDRESSIQCPCSWSRSHVSMPLYNQLFVIIHVDRNVNVTGSIVPGLQLGLANTRYVWNSTSTPQLGLNNRSLSIQRGHILGGSSSVSEYHLCTMLNLDL